MAEKLVHAVRAAVGPDAGGPPDAELLRRFATGADGGAFELLVWRHAGMVRATCRAVLRDYHLAEDAAQAAFLLLARKADRVRENPAGWLHRVARRTAVRMRRSVGRAVPDAVAPRVGHSPTYGSDELAVLHAEVAALPDRYRLPVLLCFVEGLSHADAAARLGWPVGTVAGRIARAKDALRPRLARRGLAPSLAGLAVAGGDGAFAAATARAAVAFAAGESAGVSPTVLPLVRGAMRAMTVAKLKLAAGAVALCGAITAGGVWAGGQPPGPGPQPAAVRRAVAADAPNPGRPEDPNRTADYPARRQSLKNLKQIVLAWYNYASAHGRLATDLVGRDGNRLLSWRVQLLPFLQQEELYRQFKLDEPWDGPTNKPLLAKMPAVFRTRFQPADATRTYYQGFAGPGTLFGPGGPLTHAAIRDGSSNTLAVAEVGPAVPWTRPADVPYDPAGAFPAVVWPFANVLNLGLADGSCYHASPAVTERQLRTWIDADDGLVAPDLTALKPVFPNQEADERAEADRLLAENMVLLDQMRFLLEQYSVLIKRPPHVGNPDRQEAIGAGLRLLVEQQAARNERLKGKPKDPALKK